MSWAAGWWQLLSCHAVVTPGADRILRAPAMSDTGTWPPTPLTGTVLLHTWTGTWLWLTLTSPPADSRPSEPAMPVIGTWPPTPLTGTKLPQAWMGTWLWLTLTSPPASPPVPANAAGAHMP